MNMRFYLVALVLLCGCATMVNGTHQNVPVDSDPSGALVRVDCGDAAGSEFGQQRVIALLDLVRHRDAVGQQGLIVSRLQRNDQHDQLDVLFRKQAARAGDQGDR